MSFIAKNPIVLPEVEKPSSVPNMGTRGLFAGTDGWHDIDASGNSKKLITDDELEPFLYYDDPTTVPSDISLFNFATPEDGEVEVSLKLLDSSFTDDTIVIPYKCKINGVSYKVTKIGYGAFMNKNCNTVLKKIVLPESIKEIGSYAFRWCQVLVDINIPHSVTKIGTGAFWDCDSFVNIPDIHSVTEIGQELFASCDNMVNIEIPKNIVSIGEKAFSGCKNLKYITFPNDSITIADDAFLECTDLTFVCNPGSDAEEYAKEKGYKVAYETIAEETLDNKVDKVEGFYLASPMMKHDMTTGKDKPAILFSDGDAEETIIIPAYTSDLENDSDFVTKKDVSDFTEELMVVFSGSDSSGISSMTDYDDMVEAYSAGKRIYGVWYESNIVLNEDRYFELVNVGSSAANSDYTFTFEHKVTTSGSELRFIRIIYSADNLEITDSTIASGGGGKDEVYIGTAEPKDGQEIWINPEGEETVLLTSDDVYLREDIDEMFSNTPSDVYTKQEVDSLIENIDIPKNTSDINNDIGFVTEQEVKNYVSDNVLSDVYNKDDVNKALANKADKNHTHEDYADKATTLGGYGITDAYTKEEVESYVAQNATGTLSPEFADSIEDLEVNGDTSKVYVLPDGYIYAYITKTYMKDKYTNSLVYGECHTGSRLNSSGLVTGASNMMVTNFIPCKCGDIVYLQDINYKPNNDSNYKIVFYSSEDESTKIGGVQSTEPGTHLDGVYSDTEGLTQFTVKDHGSFNLPEDTEIYFRISTGNFASDAVISVGNEILPPEEVTEQLWTNTGHSFTPADYEDRIVSLEDDSEDCKRRISALESDDNSDIPTYAKEEAERVTDNIMSVRTGKSLCFAALSEFHLDITGTAESEVKTQKSVKLAGQGLKELNTLNNFDAVVMLGDYTSNNSWKTENCKKDFRQVKRDFSDSFRTQPVAWLVGNHEINYDETRDRPLKENELYSYVGAGSVFMQRDVNYPEKNYGYIDFPNQQIRMICLNTADALTTFTPVDGADFKSEWISEKQLQWLADTALDFSDKPNAAEWGIVICSHHPLNYHQNIKIALKILEVYKSGESGTISENISVEGVGYPVSVSYDFSDGEKAEVICNIHGHSHNFKYEKIGSTTDKWLWRLCVPNVCVGRENECASWSQDFGEFDASGNPVYYKKTPDTAKGTSFCSITIDREIKKIYAHCFGAGYDREVSYGGDA